MSADFTPTKVCLPKRGQRVDWISPGGMQVNAGLYDGHWFLPGGMYAYYKPVAWRPAEKEGS